MALDEQSVEVTEKKKCRLLEIGMVDTMQIRLESRITQRISSSAIYM